MNKKICAAGRFGGTARHTAIKFYTCVSICGVL